jgi:hypothetical protein
MHFCVFHGHQGQERSGLCCVEPGDAKGLETCTPESEGEDGVEGAVARAAGPASVATDAAPAATPRHCGRGVKEKNLRNIRRLLVTVDDGCGGFGAAGKAGMEEEDAAKAASSAVDSGRRLVGGRGRRSWL